MIKSRHTGINVSDLVKSLEFYVDTLEMTVVENRTEQGEYIDRLTGIQGTLQHWVKVSTDDGYLLELVRWLDPGSIGAAISDRKPYDRPGINHLCFQVDSVEGIHSRLTESGYATNPIQTDPPGKVKNFSAYDPDGNIVEFVEVL